MSLDESANVLVVDVAWFPLSGLAVGMMHLVVLEVVVVVDRPHRPMGDVLSLVAQLQSMLIVKGILLMHQKELLITSIVLHEVELWE